MCQVWAGPLLLPSGLPRGVPSDHLIGTLSLIRDSRCGYEIDYGGAQISYDGTDAQVHSRTPYSLCGAGLAKNFPE